MAEAAGFGAAGWMQGAGAFMQIWGTLESGRMARIQGERARVAAEFAAEQAEQQAGVAIAISQRTAAEQRRQANLVASRALAVASASGAGVSDPTMVKILSDVRGEGVYRASVALYEGEARARQLRLDAAAGRVGGLEAQIAGLTREQGAGIAGVGRAAGAAGSLYANYGAGGPGLLNTGGSGDARLIDNGYSPGMT